MVRSITGKTHPSTCDMVVTRDGDHERCDKTAVGILRYVTDEGEPSRSPACAWHLNRYHRQAVSLDELLGGAS